MKTHFDFVDFTPSEDLRTTCYLALDQVLDHAPSDAHPEARMVKRRGGFETTVEIFSQSGYFVAHAFERTPEHSLRVAQERIESRLFQWTESRFLDQPDLFFKFPTNVSA